MAAAVIVIAAVAASVQTKKLMLVFSDHFAMRKGCHHLLQRQIHMDIDIQIRMATAVAVAAAVAVAVAAVALLSAVKSISAFPPPRRWSYYCALLYPHRD